MTSESFDPDLASIPRDDRGRYTSEEEGPSEMQLHVAQAWRRYIEDKMDYGSLLTHDWLIAALGLLHPDLANSFEERDQRQLAYLSAYQAFQKHLLVNEKIALANVRGKGYRAVMPDEQPKWAQDEAQEEIRKSLSKFRARVKHAPTGRMSDDGLRAHQAASDAADRMSTAFRARAEAQQPKQRPKPEVPPSRRA
jgi:hypothetical protein